MKHINESRNLKCKTPRALMKEALKKKKGLMWKIDLDRDGGGVRMISDDDIIGKNDNVGLDFLGDALGPRWRQVQPD